jgi:type II secretory pathway pseudopilin PulG
MHAKAIRSRKRSMSERLAEIRPLCDGGLSTAARRHAASPARNATSRRGIALILALVCLLVVAIVGAGTVQTLLREQHETQHHQLQIQTFWVAESAIQRAAAQLQRKAGYTGETWQIDAKDVGGEWPAEAVIRVEPVEGNATTRRVHVTARYPKRPLYGMIQERNIAIELPTLGETL